MYGRLAVCLCWTMAVLSAGGRYWSTSADPRPYGAYRRGEERLLEALRARRTHQCVSASSKCFTSQQCCAGLVCASMDDYFDLKPETPGYCVKEKDLQPCDDSSDCSAGNRCLPLGRSSEMYCMPSLSTPDQRPVVPASAGTAAVQPPRANPAFGNKLGGLGAACQSTADCAPYTADETSRLCCQDVHRFRQPTRRQCDRLRENISACIGPDSR